MIAILQFLGTNCERDMKYSCDLLHKDSSIIWHADCALPYDTSLVIIPGGFSYGDYLRAGAIARFSNIMKSVTKFANNGGFVLGICNGFQILCEAGLLPGVLMRNDNLLFKSRISELKIISNKNKLLSNYEINQSVFIPISHADGNYHTDNKTLESLKENDQILLRYATNINGSLENIAGICNKDKNVFGMMPHPERACESILGSNDGLKMLKNIYE